MALWRCCSCSSSATAAVWMARWSRSPTSVRMALWWRVRLPKAMARVSKVNGRIVMANNCQISPRRSRKTRRWGSLETWDMRSLFFRDGSNALGNPAQGNSPHDGLRPAAGLQLVEDVRQVSLHRAVADTQLYADGFIGI